MKFSGNTSYLRFAVVLISAFLLAACIAKEDPVVSADSVTSQSASVEPLFDSQKDAWFDLDFENKKVVLRRRDFQKHCNRIRLIWSSIHLYSTHRTSFHDWRRIMFRYKLPNSRTSRSKEEFIHHILHFCSISWDYCDFCIVCLPILNPFTSLF